MGPTLGGVVDRRVSIGGQSNGVGVGDKSELSTDLLLMYNSIFDRVFIFNPIYNRYEKLQMGVNNDAASSSHIGLEFGLAVRWTKETKRARLYIDKHAVGGVPISYFQMGKTFFDEAARRRDEQNTWLANNGCKPRRSGWVWVQGESDASNTQAYYQTALTGMVADRLANGMQAPNEIRLVVQMATGTNLYSAAIAAAKTAYAAANQPQTKLTTMAPYFNSDNLHLNARGQVQLGYDTFEAFFGKSHATAP